MRSIGEFAVRLLLALTTLIVVAGGVAPSAQAQNTNPASSASSPPDNPANDVWKYISGPLSKPPDVGITFAGPQPAIGLNPGQVIFSDDFTSQDPSWGPTDPNSFVKDGKFEFHAAAGDSITRVSNKYLLYEFDAAVSVVAEPETKMSADAGFLLWVDSNGDDVAFLIDPVQGSFAIDSVTPQKTTPVIDWSFTSTLNTGAGATNRLEVVADDKRAVFLINGHPVAQMQTPASIVSSGSSISLYASGGDGAPGDYAFTDFLVKMPSGTGLPPGVAAAPATPEGQPIFTDNFATLDPSWGFPGPSLDVNGGQLEIHAGVNTVINILNDRYSYGQADVAASVTEAAGGPSDGVGGLLFWGADNVDATAFIIEPAGGKFYAGRLAGSQFTGLVDEQASPFINTAPGAVNHIAVAIRTGNAYLIVNGHEVAELPAPAQPAGGLVGVLAQGGATAGVTVSYSDFSVTQPSANGLPPGVSAAPAPVAANAGPPSTQAPSAGAAPPPPALAPGPGETLVLADDFQTYSPAWGKSDKVVFVQDGRLVAQIPGKGFGARSNGAYRYYDADISFDGEVANGPAGSGVELLFWMQDPQHYYYLYVGASGSFWVEQLSGATVASVVPAQSSAAVKGVGQWNAVKLSIRGNVATLSINGGVVAQFAGDPPPFGGAIGLAGDNAGPAPATIEFANLRVAAPLPLRVTRGPANIATAAPTFVATGTAGDPVFEDHFQTFDPSWGTAAGVVTVDGGKLQEMAASGAVAGIISSKYLYDDADVQFGLELAETARTDTVATLFFWISGHGSDLYMLSISPLGYVSVSHRAGNQEQDVVKWLATAALKQGVGQANAIDLSLRGDQGSLSINSQAVTQFTGKAPAGGGLIGLSMLASKAGASTWEFSKLQVFAPAALAGK